MTLRVVLQTADVSARMPKPFFPNWSIIIRLKRDSQKGYLRIRAGVFKASVSLLLTEEQHKEKCGGLENPQRDFG